MNNLLPDNQAWILLGELFRAPSRVVMLRIEASVSEFEVLLGHKRRGPIVEGKMHAADIRAAGVDVEDARRQAIVPSVGRRAIIRIAAA
jgi:hypothetical protein